MPAHRLAASSATIAAGPRLRLRGAGSARRRRSSDRPRSARSPAAARRRSTWCPVEIGVPHHVRAGGRNDRDAVAHPAPCGRRLLGAGEHAPLGKVEDPARIGDQLVGRHRERAAAQALPDGGLVEQRVEAAPGLAAEDELVVEARRARRVEAPSRRGRARPRRRRRAAQSRRPREPRGSIVKPPSATRGEQAHHHRRHQQVAHDHRQPREAGRDERERRPRRTARAGSRLRSGIAPDRDRDARPGPAKKTGVLTVVAQVAGQRRDSTPEPDFCRWSSAARSFVEVSEKSGLPVTTKSVATQPSGADRRSAARSGCGRARTRPSSSTGSRGRTGATPRGASGPPRRAAGTRQAAPRPRGLQRAGPDDRRHERDVDVAAHRERGEVEAGQDQERRRSRRRTA